MQRFLSASAGSALARAAMPVLLLAVVLSALLLAGCAGRGGLSHVATDPLLEQCQKRCQQDDEYGVLTRNGCMRGCEAAKVRFPLRGSHYMSEESCRQAVNGLDVEAQLRLMDTYCEDTWVTIHRRKGCKDAARAFYGAVGEQLCRPDAR
ncbi:hypothetical protein DA2_1539 [Desulfovibrio sp. A2]|nr:hypothetical protein DA2_1539 [Desulfovibrio sp. A2]